MPARVQLSVIAGVFVVMLAVDYFFDRYELLFSTRNDAVRRRHLHRPQRGAAGQADPDVHRRVLRRRVLRRRVRAQPAAARDRDRAADPVEHPRRLGVARGAASSSPSSRTPAEKEAESIEPQHRRHQERVRAHRRQGRVEDYAGVTQSAEPAEIRRRTRAPSRTSACSTRASCPAPSPSARVARTSTASRRSSTSTATRSTARCRTTSSRRASSTRTGWSTTRRRGSTSTSSTPTATASSPRRPTRSTARSAEDESQRRGRLPGLHRERPRRASRPTTRDGHPGQRAADLLRRAGAPTTRSSTRAASTTPRPTRTTATRARGGVPVDGWFNRFVFFAHYGERNILFNGDIGDGLEDHVQPGPAGPGREGRTVADRRRRPVPGGGRRPYPVDRRRLHHARELPVRAADPARRGHQRHAHAASRGRTTGRSATSATPSRRPSTPSTAR